MRLPGHAVCRADEARHKYNCCHQKPLSAVCDIRRKALTLLVAAFFLMPFRPTSVVAGCSEMKSGEHLSGIRFAPSRLRVGNSIDAAVMLDQLDGQYAQG